MAFLLKQTDIEWLKSQYSCLHIDFIKNNIQGDISFKINYEGYRASDTYSIMVDLNKLDGFGLPKVYEESGKIYEIAKKYSIGIDGLHINPDGSFCMVIPGKEKDIFENGFTIQEFFQNGIEKFLFQMSYYEKNGKLPWGEYAHGYLGHIELYAEGEICFQEILNRITKIELFQVLLTNRQSKCLCGSGKKLRQCHKTIFKGIGKMKNDFVDANKNLKSN